jgi:hypothetical protein
MMVIDDMIANDPNVHLQPSDLVAIFVNSMSDHDCKDRPFCLYAWTGVLWMSYGVLISM